MKSCTVCPWRCTRYCVRGRESVKVYVLRDPRHLQAKDYGVRYIGISSCPAARYYFYLNPPDIHSHGGQRPVVKWCRHLHKLHIKPLFEVVEEWPYRALAEHREGEWVRWYAPHGQLRNIRKRRSRTLRRT